MFAGLFVASCSSDSQPGEARTLTSAVQLEPGEETTEYVSSHCGYEWLLVEVNGARWVTKTLGSDSAGNPTETAWPNGQATYLKMTLIDSSTLDVTVPGSGVSHSYSPGSDWPGCE